MRFVATGKERCCLERFELQVITASIPSPPQKRCETSLIVTVQRLDQQQCEILPSPLVSAVSREPAGKSGATRSGLERRIIIVLWQAVTKYDTAKSRSLTGRIEV